MKRLIKQRACLLALSALALLAICSAPVCAEEESILDEEPAVVSLQGFIVSKRFYGPPNHGDTPNSDRKVENWLLLLNKPITIRFVTDDESAYEIATDVRRLTLSSGGKGIGRALAKYVGQEVTLKGTLSRPFNESFHWTSVRMSVQSVSLAPRSTSREDRNLGTWRHEQRAR